MKRSLIGLLDLPHNSSAVRNQSQLWENVCVHFKLWIWCENTYIFTLDGVDVHVCLHATVSAHRCAFIWRQRSRSRVSSSRSLTWFSRQGLSLNMKFTNGTRLAGQWVLSFPFLLLQLLDYRYAPPRPDFFCGCWEPKLRYLCVPGRLFISGAISRALEHGSYCGVQYEIHSIRYTIIKIQ